MAILGRSTVANTFSTVSLENATWNNAGSFYVGGDETASAAKAVLQINPNGNLTVAGTTKVWNDDQGHDKTLSALAASLNRLQL